MVRAGWLGGIFGFGMVVYIISRDALGMQWHAAGQGVHSELELRLCRYL
jgi:hypothetical protein